MKVIVIGSGFGGLAVALRLLAKGHQVTILESRSKVGGRAYQLKDNGFVFDMGPSLVTAPALFDELFALFGRKKEDYFTLLPLDPFYRIYFQKDTYEFVALDYSGDVDKMKAELAKFEPDAALKYEAYYNATRPIFEASYNKYGGKAFLSLWDFLKIFPEMIKLNALIPMTSFVSKYFQSDYVRRTFSFHPLYIGTNPHSAPAALGFIPWLEREQGVWFAKGGMYEIVKSLAKLFEENGGTIRCSESVTKLITEEGLHERPKIIKVATGITEYDADVVVSNADVLHTYDLIDRSTAKINRKKRSLRKKKYSMSLFMLYLGLNKQYHDKLAHHTLILGAEYERLLKEVFDDQVMPTSLSMYLHIPTITDSTMAPEGCESMYILLPVPNTAKGFVWSDEIEQTLRDWVVSFLEQQFGLEGFSTSIMYEKHMTPNDFSSELHSIFGAAFSAQLTLLQSVYFRQHNKGTEVDGLYFVGAGTHPGPGVPGVLLTSKATAELI